MKLQVSAHAFSASAKEKIEAAGGSTTGRLTLDGYAWRSWRLRHRLAGAMIFHWRRTMSHPPLTAPRTGC